jgi:hypothetical protein
MDDLPDEILNRHGGNQTCTIGYDPCGWHRNRVSRFRYDALAAVWHGVLAALV